MLFKSKLSSKLLRLGLLQLILLAVFSTSLSAKGNSSYSPGFPFLIFNLDTIPGNPYYNSTVSKTNDTLPFPIHDRRGDYLSDSGRTTFNLNDPSNITDSIAYDPATHLYTVYEKIGNNYYRTPTTYTFDEYWAMEEKKDEEDYFRKRANTMDLLNHNLVKPKLSVYDNLFNRLFGNGKIDIVPQGNVDVTAGYQGQNIENPTLPEAARKSGGLDFNMNAQVNVNANIGDKLKFPINYNTLANFGQENQLKLDYTGVDDEIVKRFTAGNVSFTTRSTLIPGAQQLFGIKTQLQFGKLFVTGILANQKSQRQTVNLAGGSATQTINIKADEYQENQHFLLAQYFRANFNKAMSNLPAITTSITILRMEVWVTNHVGTTADARTIVGLADLGEDSPYLAPPTVTPLGVPLPSNTSNTLYNSAKDIAGRDPSTVVTNLQNSMGLTPVQDFEKTFARKLDSTQYTFNKQLGYLSLNQPLQPSDVLAVAYQYSYNGKIYQVGEFSQDVPPDTTAGAPQQVLYVKLLKATSQRPNLPIWKLMMKNIYSIGYGSLNPSNFQLDVVYQQPSLGAKRYVPFGNKNQGAPIISLLNLDRLNSQLDPQPDGIFDYVEGYTVISQYSRIIFPVLEPFGRDLANAIYTAPVPDSARDTLFYPLYDSIKAVAMEFPNLDRFQLTGKAQTTGSSDISIGYNIPRGSVTVTAGGQTLVEGTDYDINYDLGTIKIINQAILNAGIPVQVNFENNATFGIQQRSYMGLRFDYQLKNTDKQQISLGATAVKLSERPFFTKVNYGEDPIDNKMYGVDGSLKQDMARVSKIFSQLTHSTTATPSTLNAYAEAAFLKPGHASQIGSGSSGAVYIDDFEGSTSSIDLRFPSISWALASTPVGARDSANEPELFPESDSINSLIYGMNRAKIAWYQIEPALQQLGGTNNPISSATLLSDPRAREVYQTEIFPATTPGLGQNQLVTFDLAYYPKNKGPYNYDARTGSIDGNDNLLNPQKRWGGLMRSLDQTDFVTANVQYIEFWLQDPYIQSTNTTPGGKLYFDLGDVSEDILKDGNRFFENGLPTPNIPAQVTTSVWGQQPSNPIQVANAFSTDPTDRAYQDVGFDGLNDSAETRQQAAYLHQLFVTDHVTDPSVQKDPSQDDYVHYRDPSFTANDGILTRYKNYNGPEGNSPINNGSAISTAETLYPDAEDLNQDNTTNETEGYFQYMVHIEDSLSPYMQVGTNFISNRISVPITTVDGKEHDEVWYQFRIPITSYNNVVGTPDFNSIRFMRMFLTGFSDSIVMRFGELELSRNTWRNFQYEIDTSGNYDSLSIYNPPANFSVGEVNIEQDLQRVPLPYRTPSAIQRQQIQSNDGVNLLLNEQSMTLNFCGLQQNDSRGVFETLPGRDLRNYGNLLMYIHAEADAVNGTNLKDTDLNAVIRIGADFVNNYYEVKIPLYLTPLTTAGLATGTQASQDAYNDTLWRAINSLNLDLTLLPKIKEARNLSGHNPGSIYSERQPSGQTYSIMGNPNIGEVDGILIGVQNAHASTACGQIWVDELRLTDLNEQGGAAAVARVNMNLADLGTVSASMAMHTIGFGTLEQGVNDRAKDDFLQYDIGANLELGKLLPKKAAISIPVLASYTQSVSTPEYDPYDLDIKLKDKLAQAPAAQRDSIKSQAITFNSTTTVNFTNVHKTKTSKTKPKIYDISNFDVSYSFIQINEHDPLTQYNNVTRQRGNIGYNFTTQPAYIEPFKKLKLFKKTKTHWFDLIKDFNFNLTPSQISVRADITRQFGVSRVRSIGTGTEYSIPETYNKYFTFERDYIFRWNLTRSLNFNLNATNQSRIDEPYGRIDDKAKRDSVWGNFLKGGRNTMYNQSTNFTYTLPTNKFPILDFTTINLKYQATYNWIGASLLAVSLGNVLENSQQEEATAQLDFTRIYNKFKFLRAIEQPRPKSKDNSNDYTTKTDTVFHSVMRDGLKIKEIKRLKIKEIPNPKLMPDVGTLGRVLGKLLTSVKQVNFSYSDNANTRLPGYTDSTRFVGQDWNSMEPGLGFILGQQPDQAWLDRAAAKGLISKDSTLSDLFQQAYNQRLTLTAQLQPVKDLNITLSASKSFNKNYSELFKDTTGTGNDFAHLSPYAGGGFDVSYTSYKTLFTKFDPNRVSETFLTFQNYRVNISQRLGKMNPNSGVVQPGQYAYGYNLYATDVLIPAFIAAYSGQDPNKVGLIKETNPNIKSNPFSSFLPEPNWKLDYTGLAKLPGFNKIFTSFTLSHAYSGDLSMNGFTSALIYESRYDYPSFYDSSARSFVPYFLIPNVTIQEQFAPVVGVDMTLKNQMQFKFDYNKQRTLSLSLIDYQLSETRSTSITFGMGYRKKGLNLPIKKLPKFLSKKGSSKLDNEINFRCDFKILDNVTANSTLDQMNNYATSGSKEITFSPTLDYYLNSKVNVKFYYDRRRVIPYISSSAPITTTRAGVTIRISLAP
jgi:cell surface protein SprA